MSRRRGAVMAFFQGLLEHAAVERQLGDQELESADLGFEFCYAKLFIRYGVLLEGLPAVVGGGSDPGLAAGMVDVQAGVEIGLEVAEDSRDLVRSGSFSHESLPGSLPVVRFPLRLDQVLGGRPSRSSCVPVPVSVAVALDDQVIAAGSRSGSLEKPQPGTVEGC